jgi:hypothetical protein
MGAGTTMGFRVGTMGIAGGNGHAGDTIHSS